jgi:hypothetical protein
VGLLRAGGPALDAVLDAGQETANAYATDEQRKSVLAVWDAL